ncbi:MAG: hypothetical protein DI556_18180 [Rhodovulum sulfidophilum]|uniref:Uncharacterized protein n=1 Tax=Rhodovulum sulfidophilum TaxID=35806 RepID=A0A2W5N180_RHOSU|nr:MAG: hypothetical protein DI556_18180 [Rhodovulum sulfidophilum]
MGKSVLIVGEDPALIDFDAPDAPKGMSAEKVMAGLNGSVERLEKAGHSADLLLTRDAETVEAQLGAALDARRYDVVVIGAGLRVLPPMTAQFERLINALGRLAPGTPIAFNDQPDDSDVAALRWI